MTHELGSALARTIADARTSRGLSVAMLAERAGVSRAMISRIESDSAQPTAALLGRLSGALGMTLSQLIARAEGDVDRLTRADDQNIWVDPTTGYIRRAVSRPSETALEMVEVTLPPGASVSYPADAYRFIEQIVWVLAGSLRVIEGADARDLSAGDSLRFGPPQDSTFHNPTAVPCRYVVALTKR